MTFKRPENISEMSRAELAELRAQAVKIQQEIAAIDDDAELDERLDEFDETVAAIAEIDARDTELAAEEEAVAERRAAARAAAGGDEDGEDETDPDEEEDDESDDGEGDEEDSTPEPADTEREPVTASASARRGAARKAGRRAPKPLPSGDEGQTPKPGAALIAAASLAGKDAGDTLESFSDITQMFHERADRWSRKLTKRELDAKPRAVVELSSRHERRPVARIDLSSRSAVDTRGMSTTEQYQAIIDAANTKNLRQSGGLVAAGGWCAPSETIYDGFLALETVSGILDLPTATADRGGINFTKGPDYGSIAASWGFMQTEAEAEAGDEKSCYEVACPSFTEIRLDAIGFCVTAGILTEAAYPELIDRVLQIGATAHAHKVNASVINRILTYVGAAVNHAELGSVTADILDAVEIQALRLRYTYSMAPDAVIEAIFPVWAVATFRSDLARRLGVENFLAVSQADVERYLAARGVRAQWVYDWQNFTSSNSGTWTKLPDTLEFVMYPAGAFVKLTTNVISLDAIYDSVNTSTNTFTAAFFEEGLAVANTGGTGVRVAVDVTKRHGAVGYPAVGAVEGVAFAPAA